jgi:hypothetical protein
MSKVIVKDRGVALWVGYGAIALGTLLLWDAYDNRGRSKPFVAKFVPGV